MLRIAASSFRRALSTDAAGASLSITERCASRLGKLVELRGHPVALRVTVDGGGCSGYQYAFAIEEAKSPSHAGDAATHASASHDGVAGRVTNAQGGQPDDIVFRKHGAEVRVDPISFAFLKGSTVDYVEELISSSFRVTENPNADAGCGCGTSFSAKA